MKLIKIVKPYFLCALITIVFSCKNKAQESTLDINSYLALADTNKIYPSDKQIEMLKDFIPNEAYQPAPNISNRAFWDKIAASKSGKEYLLTAHSVLYKAPEVPISDEIYKRANKEGNRGIYKPRYYRTMDNLERFILAECIENKGQFLPQIEVYMRAIMDMKSWLHPNHDDNENSNLEGKSITIDLGARKFGTDLTLAVVLLDDKLDTNLKNEASALVQKRITDSYLASCKGENKLNRWIRSTSNWNSVCNSGTIFSTIANSSNPQERLVAIGSAINSSKYYLSGFGNDGYCSEGIGYWSYGFGHYLYIAQTLFDYTHGKIDLFKFNNPEQLKNVGNFPENFEIQNLNYAPFADGNIVAANQKGNFPYALSAYYYNALKPDHFKFEEATEQLTAWNHEEIFSNPDTSNNKVLPDVTYFDTSGMVISRGKQQVPFSIAIKAGHNAENHNHSDVGTYTVLFGKDYITGDIGAPSYTAGAFSKTNKARSSWGHPVPRINNTLQSNGKQFIGEVLKTNFKKNRDEVVMDLKPAYEIPALKVLKRTMVNDKNGAGTMRITDDFEASENVTFGTAIMTFSKYEILDSNTLILTNKNQKLKVDVISEGGSIKITPEPVPVKALRNGKDAIRIGVDFLNPVKKGSITVVYTPIFQ
ncbi:hypothetical protein FPF71_08365 [Algibacter amylolyticus]|uniref:Heparinase n=1 Tax=Algibacter amylolyticus TaxID=1608400 RepID=A0A5M7BDI7_9FLAO|nr:heparinase II/III family protein [Algibacter amylolyticus]KAA5825195.1 hypothetical protein F2B50_08365 [Algibacter amylolyticus]MBB5268687.1 hypothetical protein [Algibacter amylolyticus]TSJ77689.1 hypothetical protein FPF71_08365 [Algibacter amylolyticus]